MDTQLCFASVTHLAERISRHELSPVDVVEAHLQRIATLDPRLFAFLEVTADGPEAGQGGHASRDRLSEDHQRGGDHGRRERLSSD